VTLATDFGTVDSYVAEMKGCVLAVCPTAAIVDITHEIPPHDIECAAYLLARAVPAFPAGTVHVAVVDPGVGGMRRPLVVRIGTADLVGPDNGLFEAFLDDGQIYRIDPARVRRQPLSSTFHGRDLFAPAAARLAAGEALESFTQPADAPVRLSHRGRRLRIVWVDRFGNCIINLEPALLEGGGDWVLRAGSHVIRRVVATYSEAHAGEPVLVQGSGGFLEIALREASAARVLGLDRDTPLELEKGDS
jgi:S-adenosylmethionine hydrolase